MPIDKIAANLTYGPLTMDLDALSAWIEKFKERRLDVSTADFARHSYTTVSPSIAYNYAEITDWCTTHFGDSATAYWEENYTWPEDDRWFVEGTTYWFRNQKDAEWFILKWN